MKITQITLSFLASIMIAHYSISQTDSADMILGEWTPGHGDARVKITRENNAFIGTIVWLKEPIDKKTGEPRTNNNSRDSALRDQPLLGLRIVDGFQYANGQLWEDGTVYDPESGRTYCGKITLINKNELRLRGNICGLSLLGRNDTWIRYRDADTTP